MAKTTGLTTRNKTLGEMMGELRARLGFITQGPAARGNDTVMKSFCQEAHEYVYEELDPSDMRYKSVIRLLPGEVYYDWHDDDEDIGIDPSQVISVYVTCEELTQGITERDRSPAASRGRPIKYDTLNGQLEVCPMPDRPYDLVIEHTCMLTRFEQAADRPNVPYRLVFLYALANAKAHYRHPDAQAAATTFQNMLARRKSKQKENRRYFVSAARTRPACDRQVVRSADGYRLKG